jgi:hypothetical protein
VAARRLPMRLGRLRGNESQWSQWLLRLQSFTKRLRFGLAKSVLAPQEIVYSYSKLFVAKVILLLLSIKISENISKENIQDRSETQ